MTARAAIVVAALLASNVAFAQSAPLDAAPSAQTSVSSSAVDPAGSAHSARVEPQPPIPVSLFALLEADYVAASSEAEALAGFALHRARIGLDAKPLPWLSLRLSGEYARANVSIIDAYASFRATDELEINAGFQRVPTSPTVRDEPEFTLPVPDRAMTINALTFARDLGVEAHWTPRRWPVEAWARIGNGSGNPLGPEISVPTAIARFDLVWGRARASASRDETWGVRVGIAGMVNSVPDRIGIAGVSPVGFTFFRPVTIEGLRARLTGHLRAYAGPLMLSIEGGFARDSRSRDLDGNPMTPRVSIDPIYTAGATVELACMLTGHRRHADE